MKYYFVEYASRIVEIPTSHRNREANHKTRQYHFDYGNARLMLLSQETAAAQDVIRMINAILNNCEAPIFVLKLTNKSKQS